MAGMNLPADWETAEYGTHLFLLGEVFDHFKPKTILECGSGRYSTAFFLSQPIDRLVSIENNPEWTFKPSDPRHEVVSVEGPVVDHLPDLGFDLIFVDDDPVDAREQTIAKVLAKATGLVVIHDTDYEPFHRQIAWRPNHTDTSRKPNTTVTFPQATKEFHSWLATR